MLNDRVRFLSSEIRHCRARLRTLVKELGASKERTGKRSDCATEELLYNQAVADDEFASAMLQAMIEYKQLTLAMKIAANEVLQECLNS